MGKDMQRALLWAILFTSCFLLWDNYQVYKGEKSFFHTEAVEQQVAADAASGVPTGKMSMLRFRLPSQPSRIRSLLKPTA